MYPDIQVSVDTCTLYFENLTAANSKLQPAAGILYNNTLYNSVHIY